MIKITKSTGTYVVANDAGMNIGRIELYDEGKYQFEPWTPHISEDELLAVWSIIRKLNTGWQVESGTYEGPSLAKFLTL
jgi:hypothetical protein